MQQKQKKANEREEPKQLCGSMSNPLALGLCGWSPHRVLPGPAPRVFPLALSLQHVAPVLPSFREPLSPRAISGLRGLPLPSDFFPAGLSPKY